MENETRVCSFPPIVDDDSRILVLGTMPGAESLRQQRYYAYERNHFWTVIFGVFGRERPDDYDERVCFLHEKCIALWDVLESCVRPGSADADIRHAVPNNIAGLLETYSKIKAVCMNGNGAAALFKKHIRPNLARDIHIEVLPSTSPAYAIPYRRKLDGWKKILDFL